MKLLHITLNKWYLVKWYVVKIICVYADLSYLNRLKFPRQFNWDTVYIIRIRIAPSYHLFGGGEQSGEW